ncbi:hypothetical protein Zmor_013608 [Zophobas morio]|uniref:Uncharacterized protein n=1 Tax=Zophobas morio TaxID=2755281 RepID=A0AA38IIS9_9CUCU|nr:hypothetical protein Zmor_013608 [Zophobas morio]
MPKPLHKDVKQMDDNLVDYFAKERDSGEPLLPLTAVQDVKGCCCSGCMCANSELRGTTNKNRRRCTFSQEIETPEQSKCVILALRSSVLFENAYMEWSKKKYMLHDRH